MCWRGRHTWSAEPQIVVLEFDGPFWRERLLDACADCATETTVIEMCGILWRLARFVVTDDIAAIVLPCHA